jgi:hypothetical protein
MGGFRSFGPSAEPAEAKPVKKESSFSDAKYSSHGSTHKISKSAASSAAPSPTAATPGSDGLAPPKKKFTLKLAKKPSGSSG